MNIYRHQRGLAVAVAALHHRHAALHRRRNLRRIIADVLLACLYRHVLPDLESHPDLDSGCSGGHGTGRRPRHRPRRSTRSRSAPLQSPPASRPSKPRARREAHASTVAVSDQSFLILHTDPDRIDWKASVDLSMSSMRVIDVKLEEVSELLPLLPSPSTSKLQCEEEHATAAVTGDNQIFAGLHAEHEEIDWEACLDLSMLSTMALNAKYEECTGFRTPKPKWQR